MGEVVDLRVLRECSRNLEFVAEARFGMDNISDHLYRYVKTEKDIEFIRRELDRTEHTVRRLAEMAPTELRKRYLPKVLDSFFITRGIIDRIEGLVREKKKGEAEALIDVELTDEIFKVGGDYEEALVECYLKAKKLASEGSPSSCPSGHSCCPRPEGEGHTLDRNTIRKLLKVS